MGDDVAVDTLGLFGKPLDEASSVGNFASTFSQRLALFPTEQAGEVFLIGHDQVVPVTQDRAALLGSLATPCRQSSICRVDGSSRLAMAERSDF
ncbi:hypothetical protein FQZ97_839310 [compost metagenome]